MSGYNSAPDMADMIAGLAARVEALERTRTITVGATTPSTSPEDGALAGDTSGPYLWVRVGGTWRRTAALV